jgi:hypothetical protein
LLPDWSDITCMNVPRCEKRCCSAGRTEGSRSSPVGHGGIGKSCVVLIKIGDHLFHFFARKKAALNEILTKFLLKRPLVREQDPCLIGGKEAKVQRPLPEKEGHTAESEDRADVLVIQPAPALRNDPQRRSLAHLPRKRLEQHLIGYASAVVEVTTDLVPLLRHSALVQPACLGNAKGPRC